MDGDGRLAPDRLLTSKLGKMVALPECVEREAEGQLVAVGHDAENEAGGSGVVVRSLDETSHDVALSTASEAEVENSASEDDSADHGAVISEIVDLAVDAPGSETVAEVRELIAKQETTLVRSALRMNSLDGDDAALLSEFLSRAQAKRAANAAMVSDESKNVIQKNGSDEDKEGSEEQVAATLRSPVVQSRRALEELDVNSPSIQKQLTSSPVKAEKEPESPNASEPGEDISSPTVLRRRSTRTKPSKAQQTRSLPPAVPNQIPVRRANGTEFVFLQRTEAHDLALTTRKNTRRNKGNSILPKYLLQAMSRQESSEESLSAEEKEKSQSRKHAGSKQVCWRDEQLVEFAPERTFQALESPKKSSTSRREGSKPRQETTAMTNQALPATPSKKVRRVNMAAMNSNNTTTDTNSATANKSVAAGTPIPKRKKLIPRVPRGSVAATATATATATNTSTSTNTAKPSSQHPSKTPSAATTTAPTSVNRQSSAVSSSQHTAQKASGIPRSKTLSKTAGASSAGATPMVKRMRARRTAV